MKKLGVLFFSAALLLGACGGNEKSGSGDTVNTGASQETKVMKLASVAGDNAMAPYKIFEEMVEKNTNGSIDVQFYNNGELGGDVQALESVRGGSVESAIMSTTILANLDPIFNVIDIPFLFDTLDDAYKVLDSEIGETLNEKLAGYNIINLGYPVANQRHLTYNNKTEIRTPDELKGLSIRTLENSLHVKLWESLGANPTAISFNELYTALESNIVSAQENPYATIESAKLHEVQEYLTQTGHITLAYAFMVSDSFWNKLSDEEKKVIEEAADATIKKVRENNENVVVENLKLIEEKTKIVELTADEKQLWKEKAKGAYDEYRKAIGDELFDKAMEAVGQ